ncbi:MAG: anti-sigma regulatory factor [Terriglobia bacterium]
MTETIRVPINSDTDIVRARQMGRETAAQAGFSLTDMALIATAISELARNIVRYAKQGEITISRIEGSRSHGIMVIARDEGPGIRSTEQALQVGFSTSGSLGLGLPGVRRLMDDFEIHSKVGRGTTVTVRKWKP